MIADLDKLSMSPDGSIRDAIGSIDRNEKGIVLVVDKDRHLVGTVTDGDIRRAVLSGVSLESPIADLLATEDSNSRAQPVTALVQTNRQERLRLMKKYAIRQLPLVDDQGCLVDLVTLGDLVPDNPPRMQAVIMAGGYGERLRPLTEDLPKPMLPLGDRPLLERTIRQLQLNGIRQVDITTHYKAEKIIEHFGDGREFGVDLTYVSEHQPLGTAGALSLIDAPAEPLLIINGDILTGVNYGSMLAYHMENQADLTVGVFRYDFQVPYGVVECQGTRVVQIREKPKYTFFANAGIYIIEPGVLSYVPRGRRYDMTELIETLIADTCKAVISFPIVEYWLDIGQHVDYEQAMQDVKNGRVP